MAALLEVAMRALVTGGAGFIGSTLVRRLVAEGWEVRVLDNFSTGKRSNLVGVDGIDTVPGDIRDFDMVMKCCHGVDTVFHLAALASVQKTMEDPFTGHAINATGTLHILEACKRSGVARFVLSSSAATYGEADDFPLRESTHGLPVSPYGMHKLFDEYYSKLYSYHGWLQTVILRYFNVYGPRQDPQGDYAAVVPKFLERVMAGSRPRIFGDGLQSRDFMYVEDVAAANILAASAEGVSGGAFNVCSGRETSLLDLVHALSSVAGTEVVPEFCAPRAGDIRRSIGSPDLARLSLGFSSSWSLEAGLRQTWNWMRQNLGG